MNYPTAVPSVPLPSIIPVTVEIAFLFPYRASYFPKSADTAALMTLFSPLINRPSRNINMKNTAVGITRTSYVTTNEIIIEMKIANKATGDLFPKVKSDKSPRVILPTIAPISKQVERLAVS